MFHFKKIMTEQPPQSPISSSIRTIVPETFNYRLKQAVRQEREALIEALSKIEIPSIRDNTTGNILEFPGFRPFLMDIIEAIRSLDDIDNNW